MKVAFYRGKGKLFDRITKWFTNGEFSHCELVFSDGMSFSSSYRDKGVRYKRIIFSPERWEFLDFYTNEEEELRKWCDTHVGAKYDMWGVIGFTLSPFRDALQQRNKWYCSEICAAGMRLFGASYAMSAMPDRISPSGLYTLHRFANRA